ncbi:hypothetical protein KXD93_15520 [Mucilaginibacter sp. BJC16-A38]|uniref:hypothetical protein n=1 Tax=Mucilaginibacter phenanthrenivorans TaxID=1234842 RepID=UPI0021587299|nr:hypothetical protein [Mucilaginibacter phenanthrenivorans]MCR8559065.1 hypothetical protein [Mucilaginibacter phenanthrenivorans]
MNTFKDCRLHARFSGHPFMCSKYYGHPARFQQPLVFPIVVLAAASLWFVTAFSYPISTVVNTFQCHLHLTVASPQHIDPLIRIVQNLLSR